MHHRAVTGMVLAAAAVLALTGPVRAEIRSSSVAVPTPGWSRVALPNGIVVLTAERPGVPIVIVRVSVDAGATLDPGGKAGVANLTAMLLTRGSTTRSALEADRAIEFVGGSLESEGQRDTSEI